jgi:hypothetical protein
VEWVVAVVVVVVVEIFQDNTLGRVIQTASNLALPAEHNRMERLMEILAVVMPEAVILSPVMLGSSRVGSGRHQLRLQPRIQNPTSTPALLNMNIHPLLNGMASVSTLCTRMGGYIRR